MNTQMNQVIQGVSAILYVTISAYFELIEIAYNIL